MLNGVCLMGYDQRDGSKWWVNGSINCNDTRACGKLWFC